MIKSLLVCVALASMGGSAHSQEAPPSSDQAKRMEDLVNRAAALIEHRGRAAFADFWETRWRLVVRQHVPICL